jgi:hypothetical protein
MHVSEYKYANPIQEDIVVKQCLRLMMHMRWTGLFVFRFLPLIHQGLGQIVQTSKCQSLEEEEVSDEDN